MVYWTVTSGEQLTLNANLSKKKEKAQQNIRSHPPTWILPEITAIVAGIAPLFFTIFSTSLATLCRKKFKDNEFLLIEIPQKDEKSTVRGDPIWQSHKGSEPERQNILKHRL